MNADPFEDDMHPLPGIPLDRFTEREFAKIFQCSICLDIPTSAVMLCGCHHIFCECCLKRWLKCNGVCPSCQQVTELDDILPLKQQLSSVFELLTCRCIYSDNGCTETLKLSELNNHESSCKFSKGKIKKKGPYKKVKLFDVSRQYAKRRRLSDIFDNLKSFCDLNNENEDVLFSMLSVTLHDSGKTELAHKVENLWHEQDNYCLTADECLASRIELLQTKNQYKQQYDFLNSKGQFVFKPPSQLENAEKAAYLPSWVNFKLIDKEDNILLNHNKCILKPLDIMSGFRVSLPQFPRPNVVGVRWNYMQATAKAIYELAPEIEEGLQRLNIEGHELVLQVLIKDGGDGLGDVSQYKEKHDRFLSDKAFRYSFYILNIKAESNGVTETIWEEKLPGSVRTNRSLVEAVCDENQTAAMIVCLAPVEKEQEQMKNNYLIIEMGEHIWRKFKLRFVNSMVDEKRTRADGGLQGAGSKYICDLCYATEETAKSQLGTFIICRTLDETKAIADLLHFNHDKLNQKQLTALAKGVKCHPVLNIEHSEHKVDATHAKINIGKFIYKLLTREIAEISQWAETQDIKHLVENATHKLDCYLKSKIGINPSNDAWKLC